MRIASLLIIVFSWTSAAAFSDDIHVPADYPTIQDAIDAALAGDNVLVSPGIYEENIDFLGKAIHVNGVGGSAHTIIDGGMKGSVVTFKNGEDLQSILSGFTITNGLGAKVTNGVQSFLYGAGIYCDGSSPFIHDNLIFNNKIKDTGWAYGYSGGGLFCGSGACPTVEDNLFEENQANSGGAIHCQGQASPILRRNTIIHNHTIDYHSSSGELWTGGGAGIACIGMVSKPETELLMEDNTIQFNVSDRGAGAIRLHVRSKGVIRRNRIECNGKTSIVCHTLHSVLIEENHISDTLDGHAVYCWNCWPAVKILNNWIGRSQSGSGIWVEQTEGIISGNIITENSNSHGAGLHLSGFNEVVNNIIAFNTATGMEDGGGGIYMAYFNKSKVVNNTLVGNTACVDGGGISGPKAKATIVNTIVWNNTAPGGIEIYGDDCTVEHCAVKGGYPGTGNIDKDPLFADPVNIDLHLLYGSPCRDAGDNTAPWLGEEDFEGDPRIAWGGIVDMGADEFYPHLYVTGDKTPGGSIEGKLVGPPNTSPVGLFFGSSVLEPPIPTAWGDFHLSAPWRLVPLAPIPADGLLVLPGTIPMTPPAPYDIPMQALIGLNPDSLTNLEVIKVRN